MWPGTQAFEAATLVDYSSSTFARAGKTAHAFIVDAIAESVDKAELEERFHRVADERWARVLTTGKTVPAAHVRRYLEARSRGESPPRPKARKPQS